MEALLSLFKQRGEFSIIEVGFLYYLFPMEMKALFLPCNILNFFRHFLLVDDAGLQVYSYEVCTLVPSFLLATSTSVLWSLPLPQSLAMTLLVIFEMLESVSNNNDNNVNSDKTTTVRKAKTATTVTTVHENSNNSDNNDNSDNSDNSDNGNNSDKSENSDNSDNTDNCNNSNKQ